jgi:putative endonuclease
MSSYFVYILRCSDQSLFTEVTTDLERSLAEHQLGKRHAYSYKRRPVELVFACGFDDFDRACALEKKLRGWSRKKKEALINGDYDMLHTLAECRNATHYRYRPSAALGPPTS